MLEAPVPVKRQGGREKTTWNDASKRDMESVGLKEDVQDKVKE